jgi:hypothetical protein
MPRPQAGAVRGTVRDLGSENSDDHQNRAREEKLAENVRLLAHGVGDAVDGGETVETPSSDPRFPTA